MVVRHIKQADIHIDLGCGDASLLKVSPCRQKIGLDYLYGDNIVSTLDFADDFADYITMLAFIEHLDDPILIIKECYRVLKRRGHLIITTPFESSKKFLSLWNKNIESEHKQHFHKRSLEELLFPYFDIKIYKKYFLNQLIVCEKIERGEA